MLLRLPSFVRGAHALVCRHCAAAEGRVLSGEQRIAELAGEVSALQKQLAGALGALQEARSEGGALRDELGALGEDMQALVRENQVGRWQGAGRMHGLRLVALHALELPTAIQCSTEPGLFVVDLTQVGATQLLGGVLFGCDLT
jgi:hypothetical protein